MARFRHLSRIAFVAGLTLLAADLSYAERGGGSGGGGGGGDGGGGGSASGGRVDRFDRVSSPERTSNTERDAQRAQERAAKDASDQMKAEQKVSQDSQTQETKSETDLAQRAARDAEDAAEREAKALEDTLDQSSGSGGSGSGSDGGSDSDNSGSGSSGSDSSGSGSSGSDGSDNSGSGSSGSDGSDNSGSGSSGSSGDDGASGSAEDFRDLAARERPEFDENGFPVRRGEVISLNLSEDGVRKAKAQGFDVIERVKLRALGLEMVRLRVPKDMNAVRALEQLRNDDGRVVDFDHYFAAAGTAGVGAPAAPAPRTSSVPKTLWLGMIDTAIAPNRAIQGLRIDARDFAGGRQPFDHGTAVASILRRKGAARISSANVFSQDVRPFSPAERIVRAIDWLVGNDVPVINISIAGPPNSIVDRAVSAAAARGHLVVASVGNGGPTAPVAYPAASPGAVGVTAVDRQGRVYLHANQGNHVDIAAVGVGVAAATPKGEMKLYTGTSFATPFVAAYLARCVSGNLKRSAACVRQMETTAHDLGKPGRDPVYGAGMLND